MTGATISACTSATRRTSRTASPTLKPVTSTIRGIPSLVRECTRRGFHSCWRRWSGVFGLDLRPMKILVLAFFVGSLLVWIRLFRNVLPPSDVAALVLLVGLNPVFWELKDHVTVGHPVSVLRAAEPSSVHAGSRVRCLSGSSRNARRVAGVATYAAYATRTVALMLIPCFIAHDLIRYRRVGINAALATAVVVALAGIQHFVWIRDASYFDQISNPLTVAQQNVPAYLRALSDLWENGYSDNVRRVAFLAGGALAALG